MNLAGSMRQKIVAAVLLLLSMSYLSDAESTTAKKDSHFSLFTSKRRELEAEISDFERKLAELPPQKLKQTKGYFGYHSSLTKARHNDEDQSYQKTIEFRLLETMSNNIDSIVLMPAYNPNSNKGTSYGFPEKFRVELWDKTSEKPTRVFRSEDLDTQQTDISPVVITDIQTSANRVKIVVDKGVTKSGWEYFALGEVYIFAKDLFDTYVNLAPYADISTSDSFTSPPFWSIDSINDRISVFNMPLGSKSKAQSDFVALIPAKGKEPAIQILIDLQENQPTGRIEFFPARSPWEISLPHFGYPQHIIVEAFRDSDFSKPPIVYREISHYWNKERSTVLGDTYFSIPLFGKYSRYIRLTFSDLPIHGDSRIFAMGEIAVFYAGRNLSHNCPVKIEGIPTLKADPKLLVDNYAYQHNIIDSRTWTLGLAKRYELENKLRERRQQVELINLKEKRYWNGVLVTLLSLTATALLFLYIRTQWIKKRDLRRVRKQISSDLHDDVGSSIGAFSLGIERLKNQPNQSPQTENLVRDLGIISKEAAVALREAVWLTNQNSISLKDLAKIIKDRAVFLLGSNQVVFKTEESFPAIKIGLIQKRNIMLIFKEAMHNFIKHAKGQLLTIEFLTLDSETLVVSIEDDGIGLNRKKEETPGWGFSTMNTRATQMGGKLEVVSGSNSGTLLKLSVPISQLNKKLRQK